MDDIVNSNTGNWAYRNLHRVMSIWVISSTQDHIEHFAIRDIKSGSTAMDLMDIIMVYVAVGDTGRVSEDIFDYLRTIITPPVDAYARLTRFVPVGGAELEEVTGMEGFTLGMFETIFDDGVAKGKEEGREEGREEGFLAAAVAFLEKGMSVDAIVETLDGDDKLRAALNGYLSLQESTKTSNQSVPILDLD